MGDSDGGGGEEKLIAVARHIAKTLARSDTMTDDILNIFSNFDHRFSRDKLTMTDDRTTTTNHHHDQGDPSLDDVVSSLESQISHSLSSDRPLPLDLLDDLVSAIRHFSPMASDDRSLDRADDLLHQALFKLEQDFRHLIRRGVDSFDAAADDDDPYSSGGSDSELPGPVPVARPVTDFNIVIDCLPGPTVAALHEIVRRMAAVDYGREIAHVHSACRREFLEESLSRLSLQKLSSEEVQKLPWPELEDEIERWCKSAVVSLKVLFPSERRLCDRVFHGFPSLSDLSFMEVCRCSAIQLLNFADAVAVSSRSPERLFKVLDMYETLRDLMPEFDALFSDQYCVLLRNEAAAVWRRVGEGIRGIFMELENLIRRDPAKSAVPGGGLHPITRYVMNYVRAACKSRETLEEVFEGEMVGGSMGSLSVQMVWIMELLESNLEAKAKVYRDSGLSSVFMMNNGRYIVQKVKDSELGALLGEDWIRKHNAKVRQFHVNYQRSSWNKVLGVLKVENNNSNVVGGTNSPKPLRERLKTFNSLFEETLKAQSSWVIFDEQLREELKVSVSGNLLPAYRNFIARFQSSSEAGRNPEKHIKYSFEDVEARINNELFRGQGSSGKR